MKIIVFDLGGTLMEYKGMPYSWVDYYKTAFESVREALQLDISDDDIVKSCDILTGLNARVNYREIEYTPEYIFNNVTSHWNTGIETSIIIEKFLKAFV